MFNFFATIFNKVIAVVTSGVITIGAIFTPTVFSKQIVIKQETKNPIQEVQLEESTQESGRPQLKEATQEKIVQIKPRSKQAKVEPKKVKQEDEPIRTEQKDQGIATEQQKQVEAQREASRLAEQIQDVERQRSIKQKQTEELKRAADIKAEAQREASRLAEQIQDVERQRSIKQKQTEELKRAADIKKVDGDLLKIVAAVKPKVDGFYRDRNDANNFVITVQNTMNKYPGSSLLQQSGQQLINESNNLASILGKLVDTGNNIMREANSLLGSGVITPGLNSLADQLGDYISQRQRSDVQVESLIGTFVANEKIVLEETLAKKQEELERKQNASQAKDQLTAITGEINNQLAILGTQIEAKDAEIEAEYNRPVSMVQIERRVAQLTPELNALTSQRNVLLDKKQKVATITSKIDDYFHSGIPLSVEDKAFLLSLGINF